MMLTVPQHNRPWLPRDSDLEIQTLSEMGTARDQLSIPS